MAKAKVAKVLPGANSGFTLLEVMIAMAVAALVAVGAYLAIDAATRASEVTRSALERFERVDRTWALLENDLRHAVPRVTRLYYGEPLPAMQVDFSTDYRLHFLRAGRANPLLLPRTELARVGYRLADGTLWRDTWVNPANIEPSVANQQKLVDGVEDMQVRLLPPSAESLTAGAWLDEWPGLQDPSSLPPAVEVTLTFADLGEVTRIFEVLPGR